MLKISLLFTKYTNFAGEYLENSCNTECEIFRALCLYELEYMGGDFQICISILLIKFCILVRKNSQVISVSQFSP